MSGCKPKLFEKNKFCVIRFVDGQYNPETGLPKKRRKKEFRVKGAVQPLTGREILQMPEGDRKKRHLNVWTFFELKHQDVVEFKGELYEPKIIEEWDDLNCGPYFKARIVLRDAQCKL